MNYLWVKTNRLIKLLFPKYVWDVKAADKTVYLTFDDGPIREITEWVLNKLAIYDAKATFFCIGDNIRKNPTILKSVDEQAHAIGNHTFNHLNGWKTTTADYLENVNLCEQILNKEVPHLQTKLFRPPYGKITPKQSRLLRNNGYKIIMWDIISFDFDKGVSPEKCLANVLQNIRPGSIIVFHDSEKAAENMKYALEGTLLFLKENHYKCAALS